MNFFILLSLVAFACVGRAHSAFPRGSLFSSHEDGSAGREKMGNSRADHIDIQVEDVRTNFWI